MGGQPGFFDIDERLRELSSKGDDLDRLKKLVNFELFRADLEEAVPRADRCKGGRPPFDHVLMFKVLILQTMHSLSDERTEYLIKDRLSFMRFLGLGLGDPVPDANTIWTFREALTKAGAIEVLFRRFDQALKMSGYLAMGGQIVDATIVAAPKQRNTNEEKKVIKEGRVPEAWKPAKLAQKDCDARWTVKYSKAKPRADGLPQVDLAIPAFGYKNHVSIDRCHGLIRKWTATDAAAYDGARPAEVLDRENTASEVWADTAYRSAKNEEHLTSAASCPFSPQKQTSVRASGTSAMCPKQTWYPCHRAGSALPGARLRRARLTSFSSRSCCWTLRRDRGSFDRWDRRFASCQCPLLSLLAPSCPFGLRS
jgi:transposase, IS5 family